MYQSLARTALDLGISERQVQRLEHELFKVGALTWHDSGNHKRFGQRDNKTGRILYAFGVDLTPLAHLQATLREKLQEKRLYDAAWLETKRQISWYRRQIRSLLLEWEEGGSVPDWQHFAQSYELIAVQIRTHLALAELRSLLARHKELHVVMLAVAEQHSSAHDETPSQPSNASCKGAKNVAHYNYSTQELTDKSDCSPKAKGFQESVAETPVPTDPVSSAGLQHVTLRQAVLASSDRFRTYLPTNQRPLSWPDLVEAAYRLRGELHVSQSSWGDACETLGRVGAALCLLVTDQATLRDHEPALCAPAYFRGMVKRARSGELKLHNSIFGLAERAMNGADRVGKIG